MNDLDLTLLLSVNYYQKFPVIVPDHILKKYWFIYNQFSLADSSSAELKIRITIQQTVRKEYASILTFQFLLHILINNDTEEIRENMISIHKRLAGIINNLLEDIQDQEVLSSKNFRAIYNTSIIESRIGPYISTLNIQSGLNTQTIF
ncbi:Hypothetical_protein [Hexamita inflata]|uniref:Hypothetical_protein n=1 Tax=Hexamita inflata TaxID=28002 RepID=A0AA86P196_9EUKA|nr:Hypothetical protein HINF_LOCUS16865 [Hexamita inflata]CAI9975722.1 Hypothetical protein HINF_LOCUS63367 [Hexamita inflata]